MNDQEEKELCSKLEAATAVVAELDRQVEAHFRPLVEACLTAGDVGWARQLVGRMPDSVGKVFLLDTIRQHVLAGRTPTSEEKTLFERGLPLPPEPAVKVHWLMSNHDWWAQSKDGKWYWLRTQDVKTFEWKPAPMGPPWENRP